jgi:GNAT superfamily N-acetyltransferase
MAKTQVLLREPFDPLDRNLDLDLVLNMDFTKRPDGSLLSLPQIAFITEIDRQISEANRYEAKTLEGLKRQTYISWFSKSNGIAEKTVTSIRHNITMNFPERRSVMNDDYYSYKYRCAVFSDKYGREYLLDSRIVHNDYEDRVEEIHVSAVDQLGTLDHVSQLMVVLGNKSDGINQGRLFIKNIYTDERYQRRGLATAILAFAKEISDYQIFHSKDLTTQGAAFASSVEVDVSLLVHHRATLVSFETDDADIN